MEEHIEFFRRKEFLELLVAVDAAEAASLRQKGRCGVCSGALHSARYPRSFRLPGPPIEGVPALEICFGLCCANPACRRRHRPPSIRFAGRSPNFLRLVALVDLLNAPGSLRRQSTAARLLGFSSATLRRWVRFWCTSLRSRWWHRHLVRHPFSCSPWEFIPEVQAQPLLAWLRVLAEFLLDMFKEMARVYRPQKMEDARTVARR